MFLIKLLKKTLKLNILVEYDNRHLQSLAPHACEPAGGQDEPQEHGAHRKLAPL